MKTKYGEFIEYHTSADNLNFVTPKGLYESYNMYLECIELIEKNHIYTNCKLCEPFFSKYGLYNSIGGAKVCNSYDVILCITRLIDGETDLIYQ
jgi:aminopeptidase-like protein